MAEGETSKSEIDINFFRDHPIHEAVAPIIWLHGRWRTDNGTGTLKNMPPFTYAEEIQFSSVGQPGLSYNSFSWNPEKKMPMHQEAGFLRVHPSTNKLAFIVAQNTGLACVEEGEVNEQTVTLNSEGMARMSFSRGNPVKKTKRVFNLRSDCELEQIFYMAADDEPLTEHLRAVYRKID